MPDGADRLLIATEGVKEAISFDCAVVIAAASCVCSQVDAVSPQLRMHDCLVVVWNGRRPNGHDCSTSVLKTRNSVWIEYQHLLGAAGARNLGVDWLDGRAKMLAFVDSDDVVRPTWLSGLVEPLSSEESDVVGGVLEVFTQGRVRLVSPGTDFWYRQAVFGSNCGLTLGAWERLAGFSTNVGTCEDTDLAWRAGEIGLRVAIIDRAVVRYSLRRGLAELRQRFTWGRSSVALLRAHDLPLSHHLPSLLGLIRHKRKHGLASGPTVAGLGQFAGQCFGVVFDRFRRRSGHVDDSRRRP